MRRFRRGRPVSTGAGIKTGAKSKPTHPPEDATMLPDLVAIGHQFGLWLVIGSAWRRGRYRFVPVRCTGAGCEVRLVAYYDNLISKKSQGCSSCTVKKRAPKWLRDRMNAAQQRCQNPNDVRYDHYGGRGIEFRFANARHAADWVMDNLGLVRDLYLDRIDNDGHYEPGNLRWVDGTINVANRRPRKRQKERSRK